MNIPKIVFLISYRNRIQHKLHFEIYMKYILEDYDKNSYEIYFVHQCDNRIFNRGAMKNIGFLAMRDKYPNDYKNITFVFNDIDTLPYKKNLINYHTNIGTIKHFFGHEFALGGIVSVTGHDFELIGGFPNLWAWGFEDNTLYERAKKKNIKIDRENFYKFYDNSILELKDYKEKTLSKQNTWRYKFGILDTFNDLKNVNFNFTNEYINVISFTTLQDPEKDNYYSSQNNRYVKLDKKYIPKEIKINNFKRMMFSNR
tara:strand:+ start:2638 stop:3408 length:771 start_codon:yes stop_codon:yes gene_type:complete